MALQCVFVIIILVEFKRIICCRHFPPSDGYCVVMCFLRVIGNVTVNAILIVEPEDEN